ncbi:MAG: DUF5103 domain-containing protein [Flavobacteriaceae bacterium]|nr:DUF5103 domain-containing protein [Flavobacteriaceae bacterium]
MIKTIYLFIFLFISSVSLISQEQEIIAPEHFKTIEFIGISQQSKIPILRLGSPFKLSFDVLNGEEADFYYEINHYNFDWTPSDLSKGEFMEGFDDVRIYNYENSLNTLEIFSHYELSIPNREIKRLTKSGNYIISIKDDNGDYVFTKKFMVIEDLVAVPVAIKRSRDIRDIEYNQVVHFSINSPDLLLINPKQTVKTLVIKNNDIKGAISNLKPQYTIGSEIIYRYNKESSFGGGNEFLNFDNKDVRAATSSIRRIELTDIYNNYLYTNGARKDRPYTYNPDINGGFVVRNISARNQNIEAEYVRMHFNLQFFEDIGEKEIHIYGGFNNYTIDSSTYMEYDEYTDTYKNARLFKQGFYNYKYVLVDRDGSIDEGFIDGDFWQTENNYNVLVYYRELGGRYDRIIGLGTANSSNITNN